MKNDNKSDSKFIKLINGKGFYFAVALCMVAVGMALWSAVDSFNKISNSFDGTSSVTQMKQETSSEKSPESSDSGIVVKEETKTEAKSPASSNETAIETKTNVARYFVMPVTGKILKNYSDEYLQYSETYMDMRLHDAVDIVASEGAVINSSGDGVVLKTEKSDLYGTVVTIDHGNGIIAKYCGLNEKTDVSEGDAVTASQKIGSLASVPCEAVETPHLHFEITKDGKAVDPLSLMTVN